MGREISSTFGCQEKGYAAIVTPFEVSVKNQLLTCSITRRISGKCSSD